MELKVLGSGGRRRLRFGDLRRSLAGGQDPKIFCLSCSDCRVAVHEIFDMKEPGSIFEVKNVGGLFSADARAALVYALGHLKIQYVLVLHHTGCFGYLKTGEDVESEIRRHMLEYGGFHAKVRVSGYLADRRLVILKASVDQLIVEEGCRIQVGAMRSYLALAYPKLMREISEGRVAVLPLLLDSGSGVVYNVPEKLEGSEDMIREEF